MVIGACANPVANEVGVIADAICHIVILCGRSIHTLSNLYPNNRQQKCLDHIPVLLKYIKILGINFLV